jgi:hypothetical protein
MKTKFKVGETVVKVCGRTWYIRKIIQVKIEDDRGHGHDEPYAHYYFKEGGCADESEIESAKDAVKRLK